MSLKVSLNPINVKPQPSVIRDLFDFSIFGYWLFSLAITFGVVLLFFGLGVFSFSALSDLVKIMSIGMLPSDIESYWLDLLVTSVQMFFGVLVTFVVLLISWFGFSITLLTVLGLFTESIINKIRNKHYSQVPLITGFTFWTMLVEQIKVIVIYLAILIIGGIFGFVFIIILSWTAIPILMIWSFFLYRSLLLIDCGLSIFQPNELRRHKRWFNYKLWMPVGSTFAMSFVPVLNLLVPLIAVVWVSHVMLASKAEELQQSE